MYNFFKRNQKQLLAVFGVVLMFTFLMPSLRTANSTRGDEAIGSIGDTKIYKDDLDHSEAEWDFLARRMVVRAAASGDNQWASLVVAIPEFQPLAMQMRDNPHTYFLLKYEAQQMGMVPPLDQAERILSDPRGDIAVVMPDDSKVQWTSITDDDLRDNAKGAVADLLMVDGAFRRALDSVKVSDPLIQHDLASQYQQIKSRVVDFPIKDDLDKVADPTPEQLKKQFDQFAQTEAGADKGLGNPFGFGYKYPNRVKVQYIGIPKSEVRKAIQAQKDDYGWEVDAQRYYLQHQSEFPTTAPATSQPSITLGSTTRTGPSTQPFEQVRQSILDRLIDPQARRLQQQLVTQITTKLNQDYQSYASANPTSAPASAPAQSSFESFEYFQKLAADIENQHHVTLTVASVADAFRNHDQLHDLPGIGQAPNFPDYALSAAEPFAAPQVGAQSMIIKPFQPSKPLNDDVENVYIFRVIGVDPSHQPASMDEVKDRVAEDWKKSQGWDLAKTNAHKMLDAAAGPGLDVASGDHKLIVTGFYSTDAMVPIENYRISTTSQSLFIKQTYALLSALTEKDHPRPMTLIEMPGDGKVAVAELIAVESGLSPQSISVAKLIVGDQIAQPYASSILQQWYNYDAVVQRVGYEDVRHKSSGT